MITKVELGVYKEYSIDSIDSVYLRCVTLDKVSNVLCLLGALFGILTLFLVFDSDNIVINLSFSLSTIILSVFSLIVIKVISKLEISYLKGLIREDREKMAKILEIPVVTHIKTGVEYYVVHNVLIEVN